ncbi:hypothetical protein [Neisseria elongata]|jgi:hypothetical protein|uniref:hypothetical protein n=1 Tax=Neisseria elongata TaxID=495 RepID=UPI00195AEAEC|nr:hypothetical protein [Neisseria elongata]MBM7064554.1 hypothetical protein [Neisseria elongata]
MKQPYLLQTSPDSLILFDNGKDNFWADFHQAFSGCEVESEHENIFALFGTDAFFTVRGGQLDLQDWDGKIYFSLSLPSRLDLADGCGVMLVGTPEPVAAERLQARFADKNDNADLSQALFDFAAQNGWESYDCLALCICLFNEQERMKREFELA